MGVVYKARHLGLNRVVALKMILAGAHAGPEERVRFLAEAQAVAAVKHPGIVQIYDLGTHASLPYFALEFCPGGSLADRLGKPLPPAEAARLVEQLARAIHAAHQAGIIHRDLKPANVLLAGSEGERRGVSPPVQASDRLPDAAPLAHFAPRITDFGLARRVEGGSGLTQTGAVMGTPSYMAPEQAQGKKEIGPAADVYALGAILYECLTGRPPFQGNDVLDTLQQVCSDDPLPPTRLQPGVPRDLETICLKCLEKEPSRRYPSAAELADDLRRFLHYEPIRARPAGIGERTVKWLRRRPAVVLAALSVGLLLAGAAVGYWLWQGMEGQRRRAEEVRREVEQKERAEAEARRLKVEYYLTFERRRGVPQGRTPLSEAQARHCRVACKFYRRAGRVERVDLVNGLGRLTGAQPDSGQARDSNFDFLERLDATTDLRRECSYRYRRDAQGNLTEETALDQYGQLLWKLHYTSPTTAQYTDPQGFPTPRTPSGAAYVRFAWSEQGYPLEIWHLDRLGRPAPDRNGVYGKRRQYNDRGQLVRVTYLDRHGRPICGAGRTAGYTARYDGLGRRIEQAHFDGDGKPAFHQDGYCRRTWRYDESGNASAVAHFGTDGKPVRRKTGDHRWEGRYDERGNIVAVAAFGSDDRPTLFHSGYHRATASYDERGHQTESACFGTDGKPVRTAYGYQRWTRRSDEHGNPIDTACYDSDGKPSLFRDGYHRWTARYDQRGRRLEGAFFGTDGRPALRKEGYHRWTARHDERGRTVEMSYLGTDGRPAMRKDGYHRWRVRYDERGNCTETAYFGRSDEPVLRKDGYQRWSKRYDEQGNPVEMAYFGTDGKPVLHRDGNHRWTARYDEHGNQTEQAFFGLHGEPVLIPSGYHRWAKRYDQRGNETEVAYFGTDGKPALSRAGHAKLARTYDPTDRVVRRTSWVLDRDGAYALKRAKRDRRRIVEEALFTADGQPAWYKDGYHRWRARYDERGKRTEVAYFGLANRPALYQGSHHRWEGRYDRRGNLVAGAFFGPDGKPTLYRDGSHRWTGKYDAHGNRTEAAFFGTDGQPVRTVSGYQRWTARYDERGNCIEEASFDTDGKPALHREGYQRWTARYDGWRRTEMAFFGTNGQPVLIFGYHRWTKRYDEKGNHVETAHFDTAGKPVVRKEGYHRWEGCYDQRGNCIWGAFFGSDGKPALHEDGYQRWTARYDGRRNRTETAYFGADGKPVLHRNGYHRLTRVYNAHDQEVDRAAFDCTGKPVRLQVLIAQVTPGGQADRLHLQVGDVLQRYAGVSVRNRTQFRQARSREQPGDAPRDLEVLRQGKPVTVAVSAGLLGVTFTERAAGSHPVGVRTEK
jgi:YD repeat-containing protein